MSEEDLTKLSDHHIYNGFHYPSYCMDVDGCRLEFKRRGYDPEELYMFNEDGTVMDVMRFNHLTELWQWLEVVSQYKKGWDSYDGYPPTEKTIEATESLITWLESLTLRAGPDGTIRVESDISKKRELSFEIDQEGCIRMYISSNELNYEHEIPIKGFYDDYSTSL